MSPVLDLNPAAPGTYSVTLDAEGPGNCATREVLSVLVVDAPEDDFTLQEPVRQCHSMECRCARPILEPVC